MVNDFGLAPSEVRNMTLGEIDAVCWARNRHDRQKEDEKELMYQELQEALGRNDH